MHRTIRQRAGLVMVTAALLLMLAALSSVLAVPGDLDPGFGVDGKKALDLGGDDYAHAMIAYPGDKLVIGGQAGLQFGVARLNTDGSLDTTFDTDGTALTSIDGPANLPDIPYALARDHADRIIAAGNNGEDFALVRYRGDNGARDNTFDSDGRLTTSLTAGVDTAYAVLEDGNFRVVAAGAAGADFGLVRYSESGTVDTGFGTNGNGEVTTVFPGGSSVAYALLLWDTGYLAIGTAGGDFALARYNFDGTLDTTFDTDGRLTTDLGTGSDIAYAAVMDSAGRIVVGGQAGSDSVLVRYLADGTPDSSFGTSGVKVVQVSASQNDRIHALKIQQPDDRIVAAGTVYTDATQSRFAVMRLLNTGAPDSVFGGTGIVTIPFYNLSTTEATGVVINSSNRIIAGGYSSNFILKDFAMVRLDGGDGTEPTWTPTFTSSPTGTDTPTDTATATETSTPTPTQPPTQTFTPTPSATQTPRPSDTPSVTPTNTLSASATPTSTGTITTAPTLTPSLTFTATATPTETLTATAMETSTETATATPDLVSTELLVNGGFEALDADNKPDLTPWVLKKAIGDKIKCDRPDKLVAHSGTCAFLFKGGVAEKAALSQIIDLTGVVFATGDTLTVSGFSNGKGALVSAKVKLIVSYTDAAQDKQILSLTSTDGYIDKTASILLQSGNVSKIKLLIKHTSPAGKLFIDDFSVRLFPGASAGSGMIALP